MGDKRFSLEMDVERSDPPSPADLPETHRDGLSAVGQTSDGLEVEVVYPARHRAEVELMEGGGLEIEVQVRVLCWDAPRQRLVVLAD